MSNNRYVIVRNRYTLAEITKLYNVLNPVIQEERNAGYTLNFGVTPQELPFIRQENLIEVEGDYFQLARCSSNRSDSTSVRVDCEHISYELIDAEDDEESKDEDEVEEYDDTPLNIALQLVQNTGFTIGYVANSGSIGNIYFRPSATNVREKLLELARYLNYEIEWYKHTVSIVERRGRPTNLPFIIGQNIRGIISDMTIEKGEPRYAYELDVLDLGHLPEYAHLATLMLGDNVQVIDPLLGINVNLRVLAYERDPFKKVTSKIQVGRVIFDFFNYDRIDKDEKEEGKKDEKTIKVNLNGFATVDVTLSTDTGSGDKKGNVWTEWATVPFAATVTINFSQKYRTVPTVNAQVYGSKTSTDVTLIESNVNGVKLYTGVTVDCTGSGDFISMHAIGRT